MKNRIFIGNHYLNLSDISHVQFHKFGGCDIKLVGGQNVFLTGVEELHND